MNFAFFKTFFNRKSYYQKQIDSLQSTLQEQEAKHQQELSQCYREQVDTLLSISRKALEATRLATDVHNLAQVSEDKVLEEWAEQSKMASLELADSIINQDIVEAVGNLDPEILERLHYLEGLDNG